MDDIRAFAGERIDVPVIEPRAAELLEHFDDRAVHYESAVFQARTDERRAGSLDSP